MNRTLTGSAAHVPTRRDQHEQYAATHGLATDQWQALGTSAQLVVTHPDALEAARRAVQDVLARMDQAASRFRPDSELTRVNSADGDWVQVGPLLARALRVAIDAAAWTGGLVDPTAGAALIAYGYDRTFSEVAVDGPALPVQVHRLAGWRSIEFDPATAGIDHGARVRVPPGTVVDLGATAKGLAADLAAAAAAEQAGCGVLVNLGGDLSVDGDPPAGGWPVAVTDTSDPSLPLDGEESAQVVVLRDGGLATSSIRARRWRRGGVEMHHLIDPRSAAPVAGPWRTVSVTAATCALANTASTAAVIVGDRAVSWLTARGLHARLVAHDGSITYAGEWPRPAGGVSR